MLPRLRIPPATARLLGFAALALIFAAMVLALTEPGDEFVNLGRNLVTSLAVAFAAYLWFFVWTSERATARLRARARERPESLFAVVPRVGRAARIFGRDRLVEEVAERATGGLQARPQLLVGDTGVGKTSVLLALADHFAKRGIVPIVVSLRDVEKLDFTELAVERFREYIDPHVRASADADKLWRWLCRGRKIAVLADDLDRARVPGVAEDPFRSAVRVALDAADRRQLPLIVATRPEGVPREAAADVVALGSLEMSADRAVAELLARTGREEHRDVALENIERGQLTDNPFYLGVVAELLRLRALNSPEPGADVHAVRVALLGAWRGALLGGDTVLPEERMRRERVLELVADFAVARLRPDWSPDPVGSFQPWSPALHAAEQLGLLELDDEGAHRFTHEAMHAYFASLAFTRRRQLLLSALEGAADSPRVQLAAVFVAAAFRDRDFCRRACSLLLASRRESDGGLLLRAAAAAELARAGAFHELDERIAEACARARRSASPLARRTALDRIARLGGGRAVETLWEFAGDDDYDVRWTAAQELVDRCSHTQMVPRELSAEAFVAGAYAYLALSERIERSLADAESLPGPVDDWAPEIVPLKHMAWILPSLRTAMRGDDVAGALVEDHLRRLSKLESSGRATRQKGLEASLAQGFKADARRNRGEAVDDDAVAMLARATFWYSRLNLLHAVALRAAGRKAPGDAPSVIDLLLGNDSGNTRGRRARLRRLHPFLRAAAQLCDWGLAEAARGEDQSAIDRYVWEDEGKVVSSVPLGLAVEAAQLVGEMVVLLNMNETGDVHERGRFGADDALPFCMQGSGSREELRDGCVGGDQCHFRLCPYEPAVNRLSAHREISRAFALYQQRTATRRIARRWGSRVRSRGLREFWADLGAAARS
ncbi:MAG TPA: ATP-binding protein [Solirubrobacteraceae bacterium]|jgi:hypothetical protein